MAEIETRIALLKDASEILGLQHRLAVHFDSGDDFSVTLDQIQSTIESKSPDYYGVALHEAALVGMIYFGDIPTRGWSGSRGVYVEDLYVDENYRSGKGIGVRLLALAADRAIVLADGDPEKAQIRLDTDRFSNDDTINFYARRNFDDSHLNLRISGSNLEDLSDASR